MKSPSGEHSKRAREPWLKWLSWRPATVNGARSAASLSAQPATEPRRGLPQLELTAGDPLWIAL